MKEPLNTPEWWAAFFEWDRMVQLEFVNEALMAEFRMKTNIPEDIAMDATESWCEDRRVHEFSGRFTLAELAVFWAAYDLTVKETNPLVIEQRDVTDGRSRTPMKLGGYTVDAWQQELRAAKTLLETKFPWVAGWRLIGLQTSQEPADGGLVPPAGMDKN